MNMPAQTHTTIQYVVFDRKTGRILHTHSRYDVAKNEDVEIPINELKEVLAKDSVILERLTNHDAANLDIIKTSPQQTGINIAADVMVDVHKKMLVQKPRLSLKTDKRELTGDGRDTAKIVIQAVDAEGSAVRNCSGKIKVTTTRGKLSERGGILDLVDGRATISLTSVNETVGKVRVTAASLGATCGSGNLIVEFV